MPRCRALLTRALVLSPAELAEYEDDPEGFVHEESVAQRGQAPALAALMRGSCASLGRA